MSNREIAEKYLTEQGYTILSYEGKEPEYKVTKKELMYSRVWEYQDFDPRQYLDKKISSENFIIRNHPLDNFDSENRTQKSQGKTGVKILLKNHRVIGGISSPVYDPHLLGNPIFSLEGKTLEEIHPEIKKLGWQTWHEKWLNGFK